MLCITRTTGTAFTIGDNIIVRVSIRGSKVLIGIQAPHELKVMRDELYTAEEWTAFEQAANANATTVDATGGGAKVGIAHGPHAKPG